ncbi:MAG TPA: rod shape-determining protein MreC [Gemmatimonadaceae bacterium]|nr:rod shape-determining protein MreC [Gemmatimonadaceae bacterium]
MAVGRSSRGDQNDARVDGVLLAVAILVAIVAMALPASRSDEMAANLRSTILAPLVSLQEKAEHTRRVFAANDSATLTTDSLVLRALDAERLASENARLRDMLGLGARLRGGFVSAEALHGPELGEEHTLVLNVGTTAGVRTFSAVIAAGGIVGYVSSVSGESSVAIVWPHPDFRVSAMADSGAAAGIVSAYGGDGASRSLMQLRGVPYRTPLEIGARIISSGIGGTFPRGIPIGTVLDTLPSDQGWARNYLVMPAVHPADANAVLVLLRDRARADLRSVWAEPAAAASVTQRAVRAGDSLSRAVAPPPNTVRDTGGTGR